MNAQVSIQPATPAARDTRARLFIAAVVAAGAVVLAASLRQILAAGLDARHLAWLGLAALTIGVGRLSVRLPGPSCKVSLSDASIFLSLLAFGPHLATVTAALDGFAASTRRKGAWHKVAFNTAGMAISMSMSSRVFTRLVPPSGLSGPRLSVSNLVVPIVALVLVQYLVNTALVSTVMALKDGVSPLTVWQDASPWAGAAYVAGSVAATLVFLIVRELGALSVLGVLPFPAILYLAYRACLNRLVRLKGTAPAA
ncbi:MAG TPA: hypothetical protein VGV60_09455 [Candidatus Polarisedimenticolia bacterium]|jgi:hypothetical protein|nr:hypothetical protein [Candidatus Polarisedimenticolia bacterium]